MIHMIKFIDVINKGYGGLDYEITSDSNALVFDKDKRKVIRQ